MKEMAKDRQSDMDMIGQMVEGSHKKVMNDLAKRQTAIQNDVICQVQNQLDSCTKDVKEWSEKSLEDKVRVDEV